MFGNNELEELKKKMHHIEFELRSMHSEFVGAHISGKKYFDSEAEYFLDGIQGRLSTFTDDFKKYGQEMKAKDTDIKTREAVKDLRISKLENDIKHLQGELYIAKHGKYYIVKTLEDTVKGGSRKAFIIRCRTASALYQDGWGTATVGKAYSRKEANDMIKHLTEGEE